MQTQNIASMIALGYCRTSRKFGIVSRIDRPDWKEFMAWKHSPWSLKDGLRWVEGLGEAGAEDFYRRCHSTDTIEFGSYNASKSFPASSGTITGFRDQIISSEARITRAIQRRNIMPRGRLLTAKYSRINGPIKGQEVICPEGVGRVREIRDNGTRITVDTYIDNRACTWDSKNVTLIPIQTIQFVEE